MLSRALLLQVERGRLVAEKPEPDRKAIPQGLKPVVFSIFTARLKSCPDTKHEFFRKL
jgi:hypothetical protein